MLTRPCQWLAIGLPLAGCPATRPRSSLGGPARLSYVDLDKLLGALSRLAAQAAMTLAKGFSQPLSRRA